VPEIAREDQEVKDEVNCCVPNVQYDAGDKGRHSTSRADKKQESEDPMVRFIESYSCWHHLKKEFGLASLLQGLAESEDEK